MTQVKFKPQPFDNQFTNLLDNFFNEFPGITRHDAANGKNSFVPVNITENENQYQLEVVAPGFEKADFSITLDQQLLTIAADKQSNTEEKSDKNIRKEYSFKSFKRSFTVNEKIDAENIDAKYVNGVLILSLPKKQIEKPASKQISIQ
jgi:HSP20 family protein